MSAHVLFNLSNGLRKSDKMRGLSSILLLFRNEFDKFNNAAARMLDPTLYLSDDVKITLLSYFLRENVNILPSFTIFYNDRHYITLPNL